MSQNLNPYDYSTENLKYEIMKLQESALDAKGYVRQLVNNPTITLEEDHNFNSRLDVPVFQPTLDSYSKALKNFNESLMTATNTVVMPKSNHLYK